MINKLTVFKSIGPDNHILSRGTSPLRTNKGTSAPPALHSGINKLKKIFDKLTFDKLIKRSFRVTVFHSTIADIQTLAYADVMECRLKNGLCQFHCSISKKRRKSGLAETIPLVIIRLLPLSHSGNCDRISVYILTKTGNIFLDDKFQ